MGREISDHNRRFLIAQTQKIGVFQVVVSDEDACNQNGKPSNLPSPIPSAYAITPYTTNTIRRTNISLETSYLT